MVKYCGHLTNQSFFILKTFIISYPVNAGFGNHFFTWNLAILLEIMLEYNVLDFEIEHLRKPADKISSLGMVVPLIFSLTNIFRPKVLSSCPKSQKLTGSWPRFCLKMAFKF